MESNQCGHTFIYGNRYVFSRIQKTSKLLVGGLEVILEMLNSSMYVSAKFKTRLESNLNIQIVLPVYSLQLALKCMEFEHEKFKFHFSSGFCRPYSQGYVDVVFDLNLLQEYGGFFFDQIKRGASIKIHCSYTQNSVLCERTGLGQKIQMKALKMVAWHSLPENTLPKSKQYSKVL